VGGQLINRALAHDALLRPPGRGAARRMYDNVRDWLSAGIFGAPKRKKEEETE
jgi:hypothetical protein